MIPFLELVNTDAGEARMQASVSLNLQEAFRTDLAAQAKSGGCSLVFKTITSRSGKQLGCTLQSGFDRVWHRVLAWASVSSHCLRPLT